MADSNTKIEGAPSSEPAVQSHHQQNEHLHRPKTVEHNPDPALDPANEHHHTHVHHDAFAERGRTDEYVYTTGTTHGLSNIVSQDPQDHDLHHHKHAHPLRHSVDEKSHMANAVGLVDPEKGRMDSEARSDVSPPIDSTAPRRGLIGRLYVRYRLYVHIVIFLFFTGWWIASLILHRDDRNWVIPFLLWLAITLRLIFFHVPITIITRPMRWVWSRTAVPVGNLIPQKWQVPAGGLLAIAVILIGAFASAESQDNTRENRAISLFGILVFLSVLWATSRNRRKINWRTVIVGMLAQFILALFVLRTQVGYDIFNFISTLARELLGFSGDGVAFLTDTNVTKLGWFLTGVLPAILFFVSIVSILFYWGVLQWFIGKFAVFFFWSMQVSGAEAVVAAASPFIGQGESVMLIRPFANHMTLAEIHQVMTSGFATISGSVLVAYIGLGVNGSALISSCIMSIPASLAVSKMRWPEEEETLTAGRVVIPDDEEHRAYNVLHAFANGAWLGLRIAGMILATLLCIIGLVGVIDGLLTWWGHYINIGDYTNSQDPYNLTLELILGYVCYPIAFLLGVPREGDNLIKSARLIGVKLIENEFIAYTMLTKDKEYADLSPRAVLIVTYALCGFANLGSLGTQIGVLSQIAPGRTGDVSRVAFSALICGALCTLMSASIAGLLITDQAAYIS